MAKRYYNLEKETKEYLKACDAKSVTPFRDIKSINDIVITQKSFNNDISFLKDLNLNGCVLWLDASIYNSYLGSGIVWNNLINSQYNAVLKNTPQFNTQNLGNFLLDGSNDYAYASGQFPAVFNFTVSFWIKINTTSNHRGIFCIKNSADAADYGAGNYVIHTVSGGYFGMEASNLFSGNTSRNNTVINQIPSHCTVVCDQSNLQVRYFLNGALDGTQTITSTLTFNDHNALFLGCRQFSTTGENNYQNPLAGNIYMYQYYNRALTQTEILQNFNATRKRFGL